MIDSSNDLLGGCTAIVSAESLLKRHHLPELGSTGVIHDFQGRVHTIRGRRAAVAAPGLRKPNYLIVLSEVVLILQIS